MTVFRRITFLAAGPASERSRSLAVEVLCGISVWPNKVSVPDIREDRLNVGIELGR
jgi:hypothetical protein